MVGIEDQVEAVVFDRFAARIGVGYGFAIDEDPQAFGQPSIPWLLGRLFAGMAEPCDILAVRAVDGLAEEPAAAAENRVGVAESNKALGEFLQVLVNGAPIDPGDL